MPDQDSEFLLQRMQERAQAQKVQQSMAYGTQFNPDERARTQEVAAQSGVTPAYAEGNEADLARASALKGFDFDGFIKNTPTTAQWFSTPENAAVAHDDVPVLQSLEEAFKGANGTGANLGFSLFPGGLVLRHGDNAVWLPSANMWVNKDASGDFHPAPSTLGGSAPYMKNFSGMPMTPQERDLLYGLHGKPESDLARLGGAFQRAAQGILGYGARVIGHGMEAADAWQDKAYGTGFSLAFKDTGIPQAMGSLAKWSDETAANYEPAQASPLTEPKGVGDFLHSLDASILEMVPYLNPLAPITMFTGSANRRAKALEEQGASPQAVLGYSAGGALPDLAIGLATGGKVKAPTAFNELLLGPTKLGLVFLAKHYGDQVVDEALGINPIQDPNENFGDWLTRNLSQGGIESFVQGFALAALPHVLPVLQQARENSQSEKLFKALGDAGQDSKLLKRLKPAYQNFVKTIATGGAVDTVFIDPDAITTYAQSEGMRPEDLASKMGVSNWSDAVTTGIKAQVPIENFSTNVAPDPDLMAHLKPDMSLRVTDPTPRERIHNQIDPAAHQAWLDSAKAQIQDLVEADPSAQSVRDELRDHFESAFKFEPSTADAYATLWANTMRVRGASEGMSADEVFRMNDYEFLRHGHDESVIIGQGSTPTALDGVLNRIRNGASDEQPQEAQPTDNLDPDAAFYQSAADGAGAGGSEPTPGEAVNAGPEAGDVAGTRGADAGSGESALSGGLPGREPDSGGTTEPAGGGPDPESAIWRAADALKALGLDPAVLDNEQIRQALREHPDQEAVQKFRDAAAEDVHGPSGTVDPDKLAERMAQAMGHEAPLPTDEVTGPATLYSARATPEWLDRVADWMKQQGYTKKEITKHLGALRGQMALMSALTPVTIDMLPTGDKSNPIRTNQDFIYKLSFDLSSMCIKRLDAQATETALRRRLDRALTTEERMALVAMFRAEGKNAPCLYCYVEAPRAKAQEFVKKAQDMVTGAAEIPAAKVDGKGKGWAPETVTMAQAAREHFSGQNVDPKEMISIVNRIIDPKYFEEMTGEQQQAQLDLEHKHKPITDFLVKQFLNAKSNLPKLYAEYNGQIMDIPQDTIQELNGYAGFRFFSSSDFQPEHVVDLLQAINDLALRKAKAHAYTKVEDFVKIFGGTGMKIQTSVFAVHDPKTGEIIPDTAQGMDWEAAQKFRKDHPDVGTVLVATSDAIAKWGRDKDWIDYIIPFHHSGMEGRFTKGLGYQDFTSTQEEKAIYPKDMPKAVVSRNESGKWDVTVDGEVRGTYDSKKEAAEGKKDYTVQKVRMHQLGVHEGISNEQMTRNYLELCRDRKIVPVFPSLMFRDFNPVEGDQVVIDNAGKARPSSKDQDDLVRAARTAQTREATARWKAMVESGEIKWDEINMDFAKFKKDYARTDTKFNEVKPNVDMDAANQVLGSYFDGTAPTSNIKPDMGIVQRMEDTIKEYATNGKDLAADAVSSIKNKTYMQGINDIPIGVEPEDGTYYASSKANQNWSFGSKDWNEYYVSRSRGSRETPDIGKRFKERMRKAMTKRGYGEFDMERNAKGQADADELAAFEASLHEAMQPTPDDLKESARGYITFGAYQYDENGENGRRKISIGMLESANLTTMIHEMGHLNLELTRDLAKRSGASDQIKQDWETIKNYLGVGEDGKITRDMHETFARSMEAYMMEGKAPSAVLTGTFARVKAWMQMVYGKISRLGVELTPEVRGVFDRMMATDAEIERASAAEPPPMFATAEDMGVPQSLFDLYASSQAGRIAAAKEQLNRESMEQFHREREAQWKEEKGKISEFVLGRLEEQPVYQAHKDLTAAREDGSKPEKLNRKQLVDAIGEKAVKAIKRGATGAVYDTQGEGLDLQTYAELHGFDSAQHLAEALRDMEPAKDISERMAQTEMVRRHGDLLTDGTITDQAVDAMHNRQAEDSLHLELKALTDKAREVKPFMDWQKRMDEAKSEAERKQIQAHWKAYKKDQARKTRQAAQEAQGAQAEAVAAERGKAQSEAFWRKGVANEIPPLSSFRESAAARITDMAPDDIKPASFLDGQRISSRKAMEALNKGDYEAAARYKQQELLNAMMFKEATKAVKEVRKLEIAAQKDMGRTVQENLGKAGGSYRDNYNALLTRYGLSDLVVSQDRESLQAWARRLYEDGREPDIDPVIMQEGRTVDYRKAPMSELRALRDALKNMKHLAYQELHAEVAGKKLDFEMERNAMIESLRANFDTKPLPVSATMPKGLGEKAADLAHRGDALLIRMERLIDWMDGGDLNGPWHRNVWQPIVDAQGAEYALAESITKKLGAALENMPKGRRLRMLDPHYVEGWGNVTKKDIISAALNMGNAENQDKLLRGMGWAHDPGILGRITDHMDASDWAFVQDTWNTLESLWPEIAALEHRMTGLEPVKVQPRPFEAKDKDGRTVAILDGGYYPIAYSPEVGAGRRQAQGDVSKMFEEGYARATTPKGHTQTRTSFADKLLLDYEQVLTQHTTKVIKDLTHREAVVYANKLLMDRDIQHALQETLGPAYENQMLPWLRGVVNDRNGSAVQGLGDFSRWASQLRSNTVAATMAWKASTMLLQLTHIPRMLTYVGPGHYTSALVDFLAHPLDLTQEVRELSQNEMKFRGENLDRDIRDQLMRQTGQNSLQHDVTRFGMHGITLIDHVVSIPLWLGVYRENLAKGADQPTAINTADRAVRLGLGSGAPKDLPAIMRNNELAKCLTMFYGFHNGGYNQLRDMGHNVDGIKDMPKFLGQTALAVLVPAILSQMVMGKGPGKDDNLAEWTIKKSLLFSLDTIPVLRDVAEHVPFMGEFTGRDYKFSPIATAFEDFGKAGDDVNKGEMHGKVDWAKAGIDAFTGAGYLAGIPGTGQIAKTGKYLWRVHQGKISNPGPVGVARGVLLGEPQKEKK